MSKNFEDILSKKNEELRKKREQSNLMIDSLMDALFEGTENYKFKCLKVENNIHNLIIEILRTDDFDEEIKEKFKGLYNLLEQVKKAIEDILKEE
jgi:hypothetical protein